MFAQCPRAIPPTFAELAKWTGVAEGTIRDWFNGRGRPTIEFLLRLLERLPDKVREEILNSACGLWPTLDHPRLKCDQTIISRLRSIMRQTHGCTFIDGEDDESRTFLIAAMGNSFLSQTERPHGAVGLDVHEADWFVGLSCVRYLHNEFRPARLEQMVKRAWPEVRSAGTQPRHRCGRRDYATSQKPERRPSQPDQSPESSGTTNRILITIKAVAD